MKTKAKLRCKGCGKQVDALGWQVLIAPNKAARRKAITANLICEVCAGLASRGRPIGPLPEGWPRRPIRLWLRDAITGCNPRVMLGLRDGYTWKMARRAFIVGAAFGAGMLVMILAQYGIV